jgi:hypothetical protein
VGTCAVVVVVVVVGMRGGGKGLREIMQKYTDR